jgi:hypothetical protein
MTLGLRYSQGCHCERRPAPHGVQGEAKQSLIFGTNDFLALGNKRVNPVRKFSTFQRDGEHRALNPMFAKKRIVSLSPLQAMGLSNGVNYEKVIWGYL